jgi:hypothetical protein
VNSTLILKRKRVKLPKYMAQNNPFAKLLKSDRLAHGQV